jgi:hypothetical protein
MEMSILNPLIPRSKPIEMGNSSSIKSSSIISFCDLEEIENGKLFPPSH